MGEIAALPDIRLERDAPNDSGEARIKARRAALNLSALNAPLYGGSKGTLRRHPVLKCSGRAALSSLRPVETRSGHSV
jgi:hypothetical protein